MKGIFVDKNGMSSIWKEGQYPRNQRDFDYDEDDENEAYLCVVSDKLDAVSWVDVCRAVEALFESHYE